MLCHWVVGSRSYRQGSSRCYLSHAAKKNLKRAQLSDFGPSRLLDGVDWYLYTDVSEQPVGGRTCCPETSVNNHQSTPRNIPEERSSHLRRGEGLKSLTPVYFLSLKGAANVRSYWNGILLGLKTCRNVSFGGTCTEVILLRKPSMPTALHIYDRLNTRMCYCMLLASYNTCYSHFVEKYPLQKQVFGMR